MSNIVSKKIPCISVVVGVIKYVAAFFISVITISLCSAQQNRVNLKQKIVVPVSSLRFDSLLSIVGRQTGARFSLNTSKFPPSRLIHLGKKAMPVGELLSTIQNDAGIYYTVLGGHIIFIDNPPHTPHPAPAKKSPPAKAPPGKRPAEKLADHKLSATKAPPIRTWQNLEPLPVIYIVDTPVVTPKDTMYGVRQYPDSLRKTDSTLVKHSGTILQTDSVFVKQYSTASKTDSVFAIQYHTGNKTDSVFVKQYHTAHKTDSVFVAQYHERYQQDSSLGGYYRKSSQNGSLSWVGTNKYIPRISLPSWQFRPSIQLSWGSNGTDSTRRAPLSIALRDSSNQQQPDKITKTTAKPVATKTNMGQDETTTAHTSPNTTNKQPATTTAHPSWVKSAWKNVFASPYQKPAPQGTRGKAPQGPFSFLLNTGVSGDEVYYVNPTIQVGLPFVYGIVSGSTNFNLAHLRVGAGVSGRLGEDWRLHLQFTTGKQDHEYYLDSNGVIFPVSVTSRLTKIALLGERQLGNHFRLQAGVVWNSQRVKYSADRDLKDIDLHYDVLNIIHAPYTISNSLSGQQINKAWIGFQVGIFYNINFNKRE